MNRSLSRFRPARSSNAVRALFSRSGRNREKGTLLHKPSVRPPFSKAQSAVSQTHILARELAEAVADGTRKDMTGIDLTVHCSRRRFGMRKLPPYRARIVEISCASKFQHLCHFPIVRSRTGASYSASPPRSAPCSIGLLHHGDPLKCGPR